MGRRWSGGTETLRFAAGTSTSNDKPTGAVVGQQPSVALGPTGRTRRPAPVLNLLRWVFPRSIKETFVPATDYRNPHMG